MSKQLNPLSRKSDLLTRDLEGEVLVYDLLVSKAYCLNETSATIWQLCDGNQSINEIKTAAGKQLKCDISDELINFALSQLNEKNLLQNTEEMDFGFGSISRREAVRKIGLGTMVALPVITALVAPQASNAQSVCSATACNCSVPNNQPFVSVSCRGTLGGTSECANTPTCDCLVVAGNGTTGGTCTGT